MGTQGCHQAEFGGHFGHVDVILDATWGPRGAIRLDLGVILGSILPHFRPQNDTRINVNKAATFGDQFFVILVVLGVRFWTYFGHFLVSGSDSQ